MDHITLGYIGTMWFNAYTKTFVCFLHKTFYYNVCKKYVYNKNIRRIKT